MYGEFNTKDILNRVFNVVLNRIKVDASLTNSNTEQMQVFFSQNVNAGATVYSPWIDISKFTRISIAGKSEVNQDWHLIVDLSYDGITYTSNLATLSGVAQGKSGDYMARLNYARLLVKNNDTVARTFDAWLKGFVGV